MYDQTLWMRKTCGQNVGRECGVSVSEKNGDGLISITAYPFRPCGGGNNEMTAVWERHPINPCKESKIWMSRDLPYRLIPRVAKRL